ncbi:MGDG synthase family glycosyltransferase [Tepidibacter hydrothermalis]|uniref:Glycosyltransferase n=1 Tax=Tepidibacter hydrothermalis TaxID=3036126 RepID=A0ABY8EFV9_9FIRM|nr:glycosyltransferase [Tepidibacter hydrothermalis]WFD09628.1 glycosyltransferase [Tepidibacter hydrothermalis]
MIKDDVLILTANFGSGHVSVANAINEQLKIYDNDLNIKVVDVVEICSPHLTDEVYKAYEILVKNTQDIYNYFYKKKANKQTMMDKIIYKMYLSKMAKYIQETNPKIIISTFPMCSGFVSMYKEKYKSEIPFITCITDIVDNFEWIYPNTDKYMVATQSVKSKLVAKGIDCNTIQVTGIPVRKKFSDKSSIDIKKKYGIKNSEFVILMMGGGLGLLPEDDEIYTYLDNLENVKTVVITGKNKEKFNYLTKKMNLKNTIVKGFTDEIDELMNNADLLITKPGGVSTFEAIHSEIPMLINNPTLAQEIENANFIENSGIGMIARNSDEIKDMVEKFIISDKLKEELKKNIKEIKKQLDTDMLIDYIENIDQKSIV